MKVQIRTLSILVGAMTALCACGEKNNYLVTVSVNAGGVVYRGSNVLNVRCREGASWAAGMDVSNCDVKGEAVIIDLKERGYLFAILQGKKGGDFTSLARGLMKGSGYDPYSSAAPPFDKVWTVKPEDMPMLVTFRDTHDPKSVVEVRPDDLSTKFGPKIVLQNLTVQRTSAPVTRGKVELILPWLKTLGKSTLAGDLASESRNLPEILRKYNFQHGF